MEYNATLRINDRLFYDIQEYCDKNDLDMMEYLVELIEERHMINKYGDLNEIIPKAIEESKVEVKKRGRPKKEVEKDKKLGDGGRGDTSHLCHIFNRCPFLHRHRPRKTAWLPLR